jgi:uncharacterized membrane protein required for colicin V production
MSWILIVVIAIFAVCGYVGWRKGIIKILVTLLSLIVTIVATLFLTPLIGKAIKNNTNLYSKLQDSVYVAMAKSDKVENAISDTGEQPDASFDKNAGTLSTYVNKVVGVLNLPDSMSNEVNTAVSEDSITEVVNQGSATVKEAVTHVVANRLADIIFSVVLYISIFILIYIVLAVVMIATGFIANLPVIHQANKTVGLLFGLAEGLLIVWLLFLILTASSNTEFAANALSDISHNKFLEFIYDNNIILKSTFRSL